MDDEIYDLKGIKEIVYGLHKNIKSLEEAIRIEKGKNILGNPRLIVLTHDYLEAKRVMGLVERKIDHEFNLLLSEGGNHEIILPTA